MEQMKDILFQCNPCVMCRNNVFNCDEHDTCNASINWNKLITNLGLLEDDNKSMRKELDGYYDAMKVGNHD